MTEEAVISYMHDVEVYFQEQGIEVVNSEYIMSYHEYYIEFNMESGHYFYNCKKIEHVHDGDDFLVDIWNFGGDNFFITEGLLHDLIVKYREL